MRAFVTGGAGFIGSHLVDGLRARGWPVTVYDRLGTGHREFLEAQSGRDENGSLPRLHLVEGDILDGDRLTEAMKGHDVVFHLAANADVRGGIRNRKVDVKQNILGTHSVLEAMVANDIHRMAFTSSAVVYGEPSMIPTPEEYLGTQTSLYGASKFAAEAMVEAYASYFQIRATIFRFVSLVGERYTHVVVFDFVKKLKNDPGSLEILGDGRQRKSYLYVGDAVDGMLLAMERSPENNSDVVRYNLGHSDVVEARRVAEIVCSEMGLKGVSFRFRGGMRGWPGDSPHVLLDTHRLRALGWSPKVSMEEGIRRTVRYLLEHPELLSRPGPTGP